MVLEKELQEVISLTSQELEEYREKVLELEDEVRTAASCPHHLPCERCYSCRVKTCNCCLGPALVCALLSSLVDKRLGGEPNPA